MGSPQGPSPVQIALIFGSNEEGQTGGEASAYARTWPLGNKAVSFVMVLAPGHDAS